MRSAPLLLLAIAVASAQPPFYSEITNAAAWGDVSAGGLFQIASPMSLPGSGVVVTLSVGNVTRDATLVVSSPNLLAGFVPADLPAGAGRVTVSAGGRILGAGDLRVARRAFGIFTQDARGGGPALAHNLG